MLEFPAVANNDSLVGESIAQKVTFDFVVPANAEAVKLDVEVYAKDAANLLESSASALQVGFELMDMTQNRQAALATAANVALSGEQRLAKSVSLPLAALRGATVRLRPVPAGLDLARVRGALVHEYGADESGIHRGEPLAPQMATNSYGISVRVQPNPFNPSTEIHFTLPAEDMVTLRIYNLQGQLVRELLRAYRPAGEHTILWDGRDDSGGAAPSATYFLRMEAGRQNLARKILLLR